VLARHGGDLPDQKQVVQMLLQDARIRGLLMQLSDELREGEVRSETLRNIGELLETQI
jgi:hypothetical protein